MADPTLIAIIAAIPATLGAIGAWQASNFRNLATQISHLEDKFDRHLDYHLRGGHDGP